MYLAIEPYVRRIWPGMLVGVVRLLSGRLRDPLVGREVLIGTVAGVGIVSFGTVADLVVRQAGLGAGASFLPTTDVWAAQSSFMWSSIFAFAGTQFDTALYVTCLLVMRLVTRRNWAAGVLGVVLFGALRLRDSPTSTPMATLAFCAAFGIVMVLLYTRVGLLAGYVMLGMSYFPRPMTTDLSAWYGPYAIASFVVIFAVAGYGFWLALAGQPIFKDILAPEKAVRA